MKVVRLKTARSLNTLSPIPKWDEDEEEKNNMEISSMMWDSKRKIQNLLQNRNNNQTKAFEEMQNYIRETSKNNISNVNIEITQLEKDYQQNLHSLKEMAKSITDPHIYDGLSRNSESRSGSRIGSGKSGRSSSRFGSRSELLIDDLESVSNSTNSEHSSKLSKNLRKTKSAFLRPIQVQDLEDGFVDSTFSPITISPLTAPSMDRRTEHSYKSKLESIEEKRNKRRENEQDEIKYLHKLLEKHIKENKELSTALKKATESELSYINHISRLEKENRLTITSQAKLSLQNETLKQELDKLKQEKPKFRYIYKTIQDNSVNNSENGTSNIIARSNSRKVAENEEELRKAKTQIEVLQQRLKLATRPVFYEQERGPTGFVCLVFTDVESSTELWEFNLEAMSNAIVTHNEVIRKALKMHNGYEVKTEGDAFFIAFSSCHNAVNCCLEIQYQLLRISWDERILKHKKAGEVRDSDGKLMFRGLRVRMGMECGYPLEKLDETTKRSDYFGPVVNAAARVSSHARGGEILLSKNVYEEISDLIPKSGSFPHSVILKDVGLVKLKGIENDEHIRSIFVKGLENRPFEPRKDEFPPAGGDKNYGSVEARLMKGKAKLQEKEQNKEESKQNKNENGEEYNEIQNEYLKKELAEKNEIIKKLEGELMSIKHDFIELQKSNPEVALNLRHRDSKILQTEVDSLRKQVEGMKTERDILQQTNQRLENELKAVRQQLKMLQNT